MLFFEMLTHYTGGNIVIGTDIVCFIMLLSLHNNRDSRFFTPLYDLIDLILKIQSACKDYSTVEILEIREIINVHLAYFCSGGIDIGRITQKEKDVYGLFLKGIHHTRKIFR